jgi:hypothetical protein
LKANSDTLANKTRPIILHHGCKFAGVSNKAKSSASRKPFVLCETWLFDEQSQNF